MQSDLEKLKDSGLIQRISLFEATIGPCKSSSSVGYYFPGLAFGR